MRLDFLSYSTTMIISPMMALRLISGLHRKISKASLRLSAQVYNSLPEDHQQPIVSPHHLQTLAEIFCRYSAQYTYGIHLVHRHLRLSPDHVMVGSKQQRLGTWTLPTPLAEATQHGDLHGHIYVLDSGNTFVPYEFRHGLLSLDAAMVDPAFFVEFTEYLVTHDLDRVLGLEVLESRLSPLDDLVEIVVDGHGSVLLSQAEIEFATQYRITGWVFAEEKGGIITYKGNQAHGAAPSGGHKLYTDGKPFTTVETLEQALLAKGFGLA